MNVFQRILLGLKIMFGRYEVTKYYYHPEHNPYKVTLVHKAFTRWHGLFRRRNFEYCGIEPTCVKEKYHAGPHSYI